LFYNIGYVQVDSTTERLATTGVSDSAISNERSVQDSLKKATIDTTYSKFFRNPFVIEKQPLYLFIDERERTPKDELFYLLSGILLLLAFNRVVFGKYFSNMFRVFFQPTFRQKQTREQLSQNNLPSLLFNLLFILSGSAYLSLIINYFKVVDVSFWFLFLYGAAILSLLYFVKFLFLLFSGWLFNVKEATGTYIFIVYLINKIAGIILIPFVIVIAFSNNTIIAVAVTCSFLVLASLFIYRYFISYAPVRKEIKVSPIHFFFYIGAFEVIPLLLIYKVLMIYMARSV
jgi:hypothetical protein